MRLTHTPDHLTVRDSPGWILGVFFIAVSSVFVLGPLGLFTNAAEVSPLERILAFAMGCIGVGVGIYILDSSPLSRAIFDRQQGRVEIRRLGVFRRSTASYPLTEVASLNIAESRDSDGDLTYQLHLTLRSGQRVPISNLWMQDRDAHEQAREAIQNFLWG